MSEPTVEQRQVRLIAVWLAIFFSVVSAPIVAACVNLLFRRLYRRIRYGCWKPSLDEKCPKIRATTCTASERSALCSICLLGLVEESDVVDARSPPTLRRLACGHLFHVACVDPWIKKGGFCPVCRRTPFPPRKLSARDMFIQQLDEQLHREELAAAAAAREAASDSEGSRGEGPLDSEGSRSEAPLDSEGSRSDPPPALETAPAGATSIASL